MDFEKIRLLEIDPHYELQNILVNPEPDNSHMNKKRTKIWFFPITFLAIYTELFDVINYFVVTLSKDLNVFYESKDALHSSESTLLLMSTCWSFFEHEIVLKRGVQEILWYFFNWKYKDIIEIKK